MRHFYENSFVIEKIINLRKYLSDDSSTNSAKEWALYKALKLFSWKYFSSQEFQPSSSDKREIFSIIPIPVQTHQAEGMVKGISKKKKVLHNYFMPLRISWYKGKSLSNKKNTVIFNIFSGFEITRDRHYAYLRG